MVRVNAGILGVPHGRLTASDDHDGFLLVGSSDAAFGFDVAGNTVVEPDLETSEFVQLVADEILPYVRGDDA